MRSGGRRARGHSGRHLRPATSARGPSGVAAVATLALLPALAAPAFAGGSVEAGERKIQAKGCVTCHGPDGMGTMPIYPNLAGQSEVYLEQQLKAFRSGRRRGEQMSIIAKDLSDGDIADLAAYYASLEPCRN